MSVQKQFTINRVNCFYLLVMSIFGLICVMPLMWGRAGLPLTITAKALSQYNQDNHLTGNQHVVDKTLLQVETRAIPTNVFETDRIWNDINIAVIDHKTNATIAINAKQNFKQCNIINNYKYTFAMHHKCGSKVFGNWARHIAYTCCKFDIQHCNQSRLNSLYNQFKCSSTSSASTWTDFSSAISSFSREKHIFLHFIREPISVILSGYNYHKTSYEKWFEDPLRTGGKTFCLFESMESTTEDNDIVVNGLKLTGLKSIANSSSKLIAVNQVLNDMQDKGLQYVYQNVNIETGILIEYQRYLCREYFVQAQLMNNIKQSQLSNNLNSDDLRIKWGYNVKFEYFFGFQFIENIKNDNFQLYQFLQKQSIFDDSVTKLLAVLGIVPYNVNDDERKGLMEILSQYKMSNLKESVLARDDHITKGKYNQTHQIHLLLSSSKQICLDVKQKTMILEYNWMFPEYC